MSVNRQDNSSIRNNQGNTITSIDSVLTTAGDILIKNSNNQTKRLAIGEEDFQLTVSNGQATWKNAVGQTMKVGYWSYPGNTAWNATWGENGVEFNQTNLTKYNHAYKIYAEFLTLSTTGSIEQVGGVGGYSTGNVTTYKNNCQELWATCSSSNYTNMSLVMADLPGLGVSAIQEMTTFVSDNSLSGIDLNWEAYSSWTTAFGVTFAGWLSDLKTSLNGVDASLNLDLPYIGNATIAAAYNFDYSTFVNSVDFITIACYDMHYDWGYGLGICPMEALVGGSYNDKDMCDNAADEQGKTTFYSGGTLGKYASDNSDNNMEKLVIGLPAYGFVHANTDNAYTFTNNLTRNKINLNTTYDTNTLLGKRDMNAELRWFTNDSTFVFCDGESMRRKAEVCRQWLKKWEIDNPLKTKPIYECMYWHLGGNNNSFYE